ncbi:MAG: DNA primase [Pirellulales bacterium]
MCFCILSGTGKTSRGNTVIEINSDVVRFRMVSFVNSSNASTTDDLKERVRDAVDIGELAASYISLRRSGKGFVGLCPWHDDSRPSLQINPERQTYRCWVCNIGGDVFSFIMKMERLEFREALEHLAERAGIPMTRNTSGSSGARKAEFHKALNWAADRYRDYLQSSPGARAAREYLKDRGLTEETIQRFGLGFAPASWDWLLKEASAAGIGTDILAATGMAVERQDASGHYDRFRERIIFPIRDPMSRCVAFGGRVLPDAASDSAKYINSPETPVFSKSSMLYGLESAREAMGKTRRAVVVEGYTDCLAARQVGIDDVVAVLGTALGEKHAALLRRYVDRIVIVLDGDDAGRRRTDEILDVLLAEPIDLRIARLPSGVDPCDFILDQGRDAFEAMLDSAVDPLDYRLDEVVARLPEGASDDVVLAAVESVLSALANASPRSPLSPSQRRLREDQVIGRLVRRFGLSRDVLRDRVKELRGRQSLSRKVTDPTTTTPLIPAKLPAWDREVIEVLVGVPEGAGIIIREVQATELQSGAGRDVLEAARRLHDGGRPVALSGLLMEIPDPRVQSMLVAVDEETTQRGPVDATERITHFQDALRRRSAEREAHASERKIKTSELDASSEAELLEQLVVQRRVAQGMTNPKEG